MANFLNVDPVDVVYRETSALFRLWVNNEPKFIIKMYLESNVESKVTREVGQFWRMSIYLIRGPRVPSEPMIHGRLFIPSVYDSPSSILDDFLQGNQEFVDETNYSLIDEWT